MIGSTLSIGWGEGTKPRGFEFLLGGVTLFEPLVPLRLDDVELPTNIGLVFEIVREDDTASAITRGEEFPKFLGCRECAFICDGDGFPVRWTFPEFRSGWMHINPCFLCNG